LPGETEADQRAEAVLKGQLDSLRLVEVDIASLVEAEVQKSGTQAPHGLVGWTDSRGTEYFDGLLC
jgi:hypothetical protein